MPQGVNQGTRPDVISANPVSGLPDYASTIISRLSGGFPFLDDTPPIHPNPCSHELRANFQIAISRDQRYEAGELPHHTAF